MLVKELVVRVICHLIGECIFDYFLKSVAPLDIHFDVPRYSFAVIKLVNGVAILSPNISLAIALSARYADHLHGLRGTRASTKIFEN